MNDANDAREKALEEVKRQYKCGKLDKAVYKKISKDIKNTVLDNKGNLVTIKKDTK